MLSGTQVVTINQPLLWMCTIIGEFEKCSKGDDILLAHIALSMKLKFDKYWGNLEELNKVLLLAVALDPRYKMLYLEYFFQMLQPIKLLQDIMINGVKSTLLQLYDEYAKKNPDVAQASLTISQSESSTQSLMEVEDNYAANMSAFMKLRQSKHIIEIKNEIDKYLSEPPEVLSNPDFDLLNWWKVNARRFLILSLITKDFLAIPTSTVASESVFSLGSRILDPFRASLTLWMVETLVCTSDWIRTTNKPLYKDHVGVELLQYVELEKMKADTITVVNEDVPDEA